MTQSTPEPSAAGPSLPPPPPPWWGCPPSKRRRWLPRLLRGFLVMAFIASVLLNIELLVLVAGGAEGLDRTTLQEGTAAQTVAVYSISGTIDQKAASTFGSFFRRVRSDGDIKAVVLRVDSPGGAVAASDEIHQFVKRIRDECNKPVVVSMGGLAASGGYYVSASADAIWAEPTTVTGSIGVIAVWPVVKNFLDKHGVEVVTIRSTQAQPWKARENFWETPDPRVRQEVLEMLDAMQAKFEQAVRSGRAGRLATRKVPQSDSQTQPAGEVEPFNGKIYLADDAVKLGMVDQIGYLNDALADAARLAGLSNPRVVEYTRHRSLLERAGGEGAASIDASLVDKLMTPRIMMLWKVD